VRIERLPYFADIVQDMRSTPAVWHCIVQRTGSSEVVAWFQEGSEAAAQQSAASELEQLRREDLDRAGQLPLTLPSGPDQAA
jgi:hypothetical protein